MSGVTPGAKKNFFSRLLLKKARPGSTSSDSVQDEVSGDEVIEFPPLKEMCYVCGFHKGGRLDFSVFSLFKDRNPECLKCFLLFSGMAAFIGLDGASKFEHKSPEGITLFETYFEKPSTVGYYYQ